MERRVLVVDDSATVRRVVAAVLGDAGYDVVGAADGAEGLERAQRERFDIALVDFVMPRLNGFQFAQAVRSVASIRDLPIVLISARADAIADRFVASTGAAGWLAKPFSPSALIEVVERALRGEGPPARRSATETADDLEVLEVAEPEEIGIPLTRPRSVVSVVQRAPERTRELVARALAPAAAALVARSPGPDEVPAALRECLTDAVLAELARALAEVAAPSSPPRRASEES